MIKREISRSSSQENTSGGKNSRFETYLFLLFVEIVNDHTNEQVESEKGSEDDEKDKVKVHVNVDLTNWLLTQLKIQKKSF